MELKAGYKQTEVGLIPKEWDAVTLKQIVEGNRLPSGIYKAKGLYGRGKRIIKVRDVFGYDYFVPDLAQKVELSDAEISNYRVRPGDIIIALASVKLEGVGKVLLVERLNEDTAYDHNVALIRLINKVDQRYVFHLFKSDLVRKQVASRATQVGTTFLKTSTILEFPLPLPATRAEQETIADALSDVDVLLAGLDRLVAKKRDLKQATMQQLLTGQTRLPGFRGNWETVWMREVLKQNATYGIVTAGTFVRNGIKMLRGGDIVEGRINTDLPKVSMEKAAEYSRTALVKNDVVIALVGYPGETARIPNQLIGANISRAVGLLRPNERVSADFLVCFLNSSNGRRMVLAPSAGSAQLVVNLSALNKLRFSVPEIAEQTAIAEVLTDMDAEIAALEQRREKTRALKQAMMQELLTGKTRLI